MNVYWKKTNMKQLILIGSLFIVGWFGVWVIPMVSAETMVEYQHHQNHEKAIRTLLEEEPNNATLWHALGVALEGQQQYQQAEEAYAKATVLGYTRNWKSQVSLSMLYHNNVAVSPNILDLPIQKSTEVGSLFQLKIDANTFQQSWGHSAVHVHARQMQYQNNNTLALGNFGIELQQYVHAEPNYMLFAAVGMKQQTLKQAMLFNEVYFKLEGTYQLTGAWNIILKHQFSKRNYNAKYQTLTGTKWTILPTIEGHYDHIHAHIQMGSGRRTSQILEENYQSNVFSAQVAYHVWQSEDEKQGIVVWAHMKSEGRFYQKLDNRPFVRKPKIRQDTESFYILGADFRSMKSFFGEQSRETWRVQGSSHFNASNMNRRAYRNPLLSKDWKRWWVSVELLWDY